MRIWPKSPNSSEAILPWPSWGPRHGGKTTLAQDYLAAHLDEPVHCSDLEDPEHLDRLADAGWPWSPEQADRHCRSAALGESVSVAAHTDRPASRPPALADPGRRFRRPDPAVLRDPRWSNRLFGALSVHGVRGGRRGQVVAAGRLPAGVSGGIQRRQHDLAQSPWRCPREPARHGEC